MTPVRLVETAQRLAAALQVCADALAEELDDHYDLRDRNMREMQSWRVAMKPVEEARAAVQQWLEQER